MKSENKTISSKYSFEKTISLLSIGGYYVEGYLENPNLPNYNLVDRAPGSSNGLVGVIQRENVIITINPNANSSHDYESEILASLDYSNKSKKIEPKQKRAFTTDISKIPEWT